MEENMGKHKDMNNTQKRKFEIHFSKILNFTSKGKTNKKHRTKR